MADITFKNVFCKKETKKSVLKRKRNIKRYYLNIFVWQLWQYIKKSRKTGLRKTVFLTTAGGN